VLGTSDQCVATHPSDLSVALVALDAVVAMDIGGGVIRAARVAAGGVGTVPWRLPDVERVLVGQAPSGQLWTDAAARAADGAKPLSDNAFKVELVKRTVARQLATIADGQV